MMESLKTLLSRQQKVNGHTCLAPHLEIQRRDVRESNSGGQIVAMMQAAKSWHRYDSAAGFGILLSLTSGRCSLRQREMRPVFVIIADVLPHQAFQMPLIQNNYMVKQIASAVADPALGHAVLPRTAEAGSLRLNAEALHSVDHFLIEIGPAIKDQMRGVES